MLTVIVTDVNDNAPVFSQPSYSTRVLARDVEKGALVLNVSATDQDAGNNSLIAYRSESKTRIWTVILANLEHVRNKPLAGSGE